MPKTIDTLQDFIDRKEVRAIDSGLVKVGCAQFSKSFVHESLALAKKQGGYVYSYNGKPYLIEANACEHLLELMDAYKEPSKQPKFKIGDWVRCSLCGHAGENPYQVTVLPFLTKNSYCYYSCSEKEQHPGRTEEYGGCREEWLEFVSPPAQQFGGEHWKFLVGRGLDDLYCVVERTEDLRDELLEIRERLGKK